MVPPTHIDLQRDLGRVEGSLFAMERDVYEIKGMLKDISDRLARIEASEAERKGAWWTLAAIATAVGAISSAVVGHFWK